MNSNTRRREAVDKVVAALKPWCPTVTPELVTNALYHSGLLDELETAADGWEKYMNLYAGAMEQLAITEVVLRRWADGQVCRYDHHDLCQTHLGHERPCPWEIANTLEEAQGAGG